MQSEYLAGVNAPRTEIARMAGSNATYAERDGPNGTIRINGSLIGQDPTRRGQMEAFAVWGRMEETGHWADARANQINGTVGADSAGDEGARYAMMAMGDVTSRTRQGDFIATYDIAVTGGRTQTLEVDTVVLRALAAEKTANGSFARENRIDGVENFGPEGHYQTTYLTAMGAGNALGMSPRETDQMANRLALGAQLPDMIENYDAFTQAMAKKDDLLADAGQKARHPFTSFESHWTPAEQRHLEGVYEGLHALPRDENVTRAWLGNERVEPAISSASGSRRAIT